MILSSFTPNNIASSSGGGNISPAADSKVVCCNGIVFSKYLLLNKFRDICLALEMGIADKIWSAKTYPSNIFTVYFHNSAGNSNSVGITIVSKVTSNEIWFKTSNSSSVFFDKGGVADNPNKSDYKVYDFIYLGYDSGAHFGFSNSFSQTINDSNLWDIKSVTRDNNNAWRCNIEFALKVASS